MASRQWKESLSAAASKNSMISPSSSTTLSALRQPPEAASLSADRKSSPTFSAPSKMWSFYEDSLVLDAEESKESVTVTVRFRSLSQHEIWQDEDIAW